MPCWAGDIWHFHSVVTSSRQMWSFPLIVLHLQSVDRSGGFSPGDTAWSVSFSLWQLLLLFFFFFWQCHVAYGTVFAEQGSNPSSLHWEHGVLSTGPPGKSLAAVTSGSSLHRLFSKCSVALVPREACEAPVPFQFDFLISHRWLLHFMYSEHMTEKIDYETLYFS